MAGGAAVRPNKKAKKIAYDILQTPKNLRQFTQPEPTKKQKKEWFKDSIIAQ
jgi:hypothetical protein